MAAIVTFTVGVGSSLLALGWNIRIKKEFVIAFGIAIIALCHILEFYGAAF
jgi:hypothetical protein